MHDLHDLELLLGFHTPIIVIESLEEARLLSFLTRRSPALPYPLFKWSITEGLRRLDVNYGHQDDTDDPTAVLRHIKTSGDPGYFVLLDFHPFMQDPMNVRLLKEIALDFDSTKKYLVLISHSLGIPPELRHFSVSFNLKLPSRSVIKKLIRDEARKWKSRQGRNVKIQTDTPILERLASNLSGVTVTDAQRLIRTAIEEDGAITVSDLPEVMKAKYELMGQDSIVSFEYDTAQFSDVAGLDNLKQWLSHRAPAFDLSEESKDSPKGIMLLGVQGCGKSLAAKAVAGLFSIPLLRLDFSTLYNKYHGETEKNLRHALRTADVMAPAVLWIDEIEKGISISSGDDGLSRRVLGTLLTWMAERKSPVFIVATSNDISQLPPELVRKGRLDEIFFVDLPDLQTREEIFRIHLRNRKLEATTFDLPQLASASPGFSGAEIEQAVVSGLYAARAAAEQLNTELLIHELGNTRPLSVVMDEQVSSLRTWARDRTVPAH